MVCKTIKMFEKTERKSVAKEPSIDEKVLEFAETYAKKALCAFKSENFNPKTYYVPGCYVTLQKIELGGDSRGDYDSKKKRIIINWDSTSEKASKIILYHECFHYADDWLKGFGVNIRLYKKMLKVSDKSVDKFTSQGIMPSDLSDEDLLRYAFYELMPLEAKAYLFAFYMNGYAIENGYINRLRELSEIYDRLYGMPSETYREAWNSFSGLFRRISQKDADALRSYVLKASSALGSCYEKRAKRHYVLKQMESLDNSIYHVLGIDY